MSIFLNCAPSPVGLGFLQGRWWRRVKLPPRFRPGYLRLWESRCLLLFVQGTYMDRDGIGCDKYVLRHPGHSFGPRSGQLHNVLANRGIETAVRWLKYKWTSQSKYGRLISFFFFFIKLVVNVLHLVFVEFYKKYLFHWDNEVFYFFYPSPSGCLCLAFWKAKNKSSHFGLWKILHPNNESICRLRVLKIFLTV